MSLWKRFFNKFIAVRYFRRSVAMFALLLNVPVLCLAIIGYMTLIDQSTQSMKQRYADALTDAVSVVDGRFSPLATMTTQFSSLPWISEYVYSKHRLTYDRLDQLALTDQIKELQVFNATNELLNGIILVLGDQKYVISSYGRNPYERFFGEFFVPQEIEDEKFKALLYEENFCQLIGPMTIENYQSETEMILCISSLPLRQKAVYANIIMAIDCSKLEDLLQSSSLSEIGQLSIYTEDNQLIAGSEILNIENRKESYYENQKENVCVFSLTSNVTGWRYVASLPYDVVHSNSNQITAIAFTAMVLYLLLSCIAACILAFYRTRPLEKLIEQASSVNNMMMDESEEFAYLERTMLQLIQSSQKSRRQLDIYRPVIRNSVLQQLLSGQSLPEETEPLEEVLNISFPYPYFSCVGFHLNKDYLENINLSESLSKDSGFAEGIFYLCDIRPSYKTVLINLSDPGALADGIKVLLNFFQEKNMQVVSVGVGECKTRQQEISDSYLESEEALNYCWLDTSSIIVYYSDLNLHPKQYMQLPRVDHIIGFLSEGLGKEAIDAAKNVINECTNDKMISLMSLRHLYYYLISQGAAAMQLKGMISQADYADEILTNEKMLPQEMQMQLESVYLSVAQNIAELSQRDNNTPMQRILEYIDNNYNDRALSLGQVAEHFRVSTSYVSRAFKLATGYNFLDYLNKRRIESAKEMLLKGETIVTVSLKVGFETDSTFRRLFKKYTGLTPTRYRELYADHTGNDSNI